VITFIYKCESKIVQVTRTIYKTSNGQKMHKDKRENKEGKKILNRLKMLHMKHTHKTLIHT